MLTLFALITHIFLGVVVESRAGETSGITTKVLYFTEKSVTPFLTSIPKRQDMEYNGVVLKPLLILSANKFLLKWLRRNCAVSS